MSTTRERYIEWRTRSLLPQLPIEIWSHIASYLNVDELLSLRLVSRLFHACVNHYTHFWSSVTLDLDRCSMPLVEKNQIQHIRLSKLDLVTHSNLYAHCSVDFIGLSLSATKAASKRPRRRLFTSADQQEFLKNTPYLRCSSISFQTLRLFGPAQLEHLLRKRVRRLAFSYECQTFEPSVLFLLKLRHLKYLRITFTHNINAVDAFARMLINTMRNVILVLFRLKRYLCSSRSLGEVTDQRQAQAVLIDLLVARVTGQSILVLFPDSEMISSQRLLFVDLLILVGIYCASLLGDCLCFGRPSSIYVVSNKYLRALTDNFIHGLVSAMTTSFLFGWSRPSLLLFGFVAGSFIDIDHFIQIRSLSLTRVLDGHGQGRPFAHNSLLLLVITFVAGCFESVLFRHQYPLYSMIFGLAWSTHHLRDAQRHGLTFLPLGETPPIDYYIPITCFLLVLIKLVPMFFSVKKLPAVNNSIV